MNVATHLQHLPYRLLKLDYESPAARIRILRIAVEAILGVSIVVQGTLLGLRLAHLSADLTPPPVASRADTPAHRADSADAAVVIMAAHLFGEAPTAAANTPDATDDPPASWVLTGTIAGRDPKAGRAILGNQEPVTHLYRVGDEPSANYRLVEVFPDRITLDHAGQMLTVKIKRSIPGSAPRILGASATVDKPEKQIPPELAERPQNFVLADALLKPAPWIDAAGKYAGLQLMGRMNGKTLKQYGLQDQDVITAVNGRSINGFRLAQQALKDMSTGQSATITVVRNGTPQQLSVTLRDDGTL